MICNLGVEVEDDGSVIKIFGVNPWEARTQMNQASNICPSHIIPLISAIFAVQSKIPSGTIFSPDGVCHDFKDRLDPPQNIFDVYNSLHSDYLSYEREKYLLNVTASEGII